LRFWFLTDWVVVIKTVPIHRVVKERRKERKERKNGKERRKEGEERRKEGEERRKKNRSRRTVFCAQCLPMELQMMLCSCVFDSSKHIVLTKHSEPAFKKLRRLLARTTLVFVVREKKIFLKEQRN